MQKNAFIVSIVAIFIATAGWSKAAPPKTGELLYIMHCAECHHHERVGLTAPPLMPSLYSKRSMEKLGDVITNGLPSTTMPAFKTKLSKDEIERVVAHIKTAVEKPEWSFDDISASRILPKKQPPKTHSMDLENVTLIMERGTKSIAVLDGKTLSKQATFYVGNVHGGPKFSYDLKKIYSASRDGIITKFDIPTLSPEFQIKAGIYSRSIAVSPDSSIVAVANQLPQNIILFNKNMNPLHKIATPGKIGGFYSLPQMDAFICSFREKAELWIIDAKKPFAVKKHLLPEPFEDFSISPVGNYILGTKRGSGSLFIYDYKKNMVLKEIPTSGLPHLASSAFWYKNGELMAGVNHIKKPILSIYSLDKLEKVDEIPLPAAGFFVRTHFATPYLWVDTMTEDIVLIDKSDFKKTKIIKAHPGVKSMHVEFTRNGKFALITIPSEDGEVVVYDTATVKKVKSIPSKHPVGKYNATNKTYPAYSMGKRSAKKITGEDVFNSSCMGCHHQIYEAFGPSFAEIANKRTSSQIRTQIAAPKFSSKSLGYKRSSMTHIKLSKNEMDLIVAYILSFKEMAN